MGMGIGYTIGNGNGREWECIKPFPIISSLFFGLGAVCCRTEIAPLLPIKFKQNFGLNIDYDFAVERKDEVIYCVNQMTL